MKFDPKKTVFVIDGSSLLYRSYYGMRPLHTSKGVPVHAVYNFCRMIKKMVEKFGVQYIALVWDSKGKTTRHEMYPEYKATRQAAPSDIFDQKDLIIEFADLVGIKQIAQVGIEADDLMYSLAKDRAKAGDVAIFVTSDKDMAQALSDRIMMYDPFKDTIVDAAKFAEQKGFPVEKLPFYFSLLGDTSDNIPGVRGVGKKGATDLVMQFDSLKDMYGRLHEVRTGRTRSALEQNKDKAFLSRDLFLLQYYPVKATKQELHYDPKNWASARPLFQELEFKSLLQELGGAKQPGEITVAQKIEKIKEYDFRCITTQKQLDALCAELHTKKAFGFDTETDGVRPLQAELVGMSFCTQEGVSWYLPLAHKTDEPQLDRDVALAAVKPILEDPTYKKYLHNVKFDQLVLWGHNVTLRGVVFDTLIAARLVSPEWQRINLKQQTFYHFDEHMLTFADVVKANKYKDFSYVPLELATYYAANDALQTFRLVPVMQKLLKKEKMQNLYNEIEHPLIEVLFAMEKEGIFVDVDILQRLDKAVTKALIIIEDNILEYVGEQSKSINLNSPKQLQQLLFEQLELPPQKKNPKGGYSTDHEVLVALSDKHPVPGLIIKYRELYKLKSTYIEALPTYVNPKTGRVHTTFSQTVAATGRLSSFEPNLQNIPTDGSRTGGLIRTAFQPKQGNLYISADYSQIELRVLAYLSKDANLTNAFLQGHDIHRETAARLFDVALDEVTHEQRQIGKRINFSILYGLTPYGLSRELGISFKDAKLYIEKYFAQYPAVSAWMERVIAFVTEHGYTQTHWGRKRAIPGIYEKNRTLYEEAKRVAVNTVAQGTAAEIMKQGMTNLFNSLNTHYPDAQILLQIHDELLITVPEKQAQSVEKLVKQELESVVDWTIPLVVTTRIGADWSQVSK